MENLDNYTHQLLFLNLEFNDVLGTTPLHAEAKGDYEIVYNINEKQCRQRRNERTFMKIRKPSLFFARPRNVRSFFASLLAKNHKTVACSRKYVRNSTRSP